MIIPAFKEAVIVMNGVELTEGQSMTIRVALEGMAMSLADGQLGDDDHGKAMTKSYMRSIDEIRIPMYNK